MKIKIKRLHENAVIPKYAKKGDAGMDLTCVSYEYKGSYIEFKTGLAFEIPEGYVGLIFPRSSVSKYSLSLANSVGVLDSGYRGEVTFRFRETSGVPNIYSIGDRIGQIMVLPFPKIEFEETDVLSDTDRGNGGYGSSGE